MPRTHVTRARPGERAAADLVEAGAVEQLKVAAPDLAARLLVLAQGRGGRNALAQLKAIQYALDRVLGAPRASLDVTAKVSWAELVEAAGRPPGEGR